MNEKPLTAGIEIARGRMIFVERVCSCVNGDLHGAHTAWIDCPRCHGARTVVVPTVEPEPDRGLDTLPIQDRPEDLAVFTAAYELLDCYARPGVKSSLVLVNELRNAMIKANRWSPRRSGGTPR